MNVMCATICHLPLLTRLTRLPKWHIAELHENDKLLRSSGLGRD
jgi:hypothetical protein